MKIFLYSSSVYSYAKMGTIKDRNGMNLTEAEDIKRWQEYTELYKKYLHDTDNHNGVITLLEPDILECEVKWALSPGEGNGNPFQYSCLENPMDRGTW